MSGHNKWSQIKHKKEKSDKARSKVFSKMAKIIAIAAKKANGNMTDPNLRSAIEKGREVNMPNENIERAVKKALTDKDSILETILYEAYGPGGAAIIIEALTDNRNKAAQEVKAILSRNNLALAAPGSAIWAFKKEKGDDGLAWQAETTIPLSDEDGALLIKLIEELEDNDEVQEVYTNAD